LKLLNWNIAGLLIHFLAFTFTVGASAEVKAPGSVLNRLCGQVDRTDRPFSIEQSANKICFATVVGEKVRYLTVQPNLGVTEVYEVLESDQEAQIKIVYVGIIGPQRLLTQKAQSGATFHSGAVTSSESSEAGDTSKLKVVLFSENSEPIVASDFELIFHTMGLGIQTLK
jgi:hypothetical protein